MTALTDARSQRAFRYAATGGLLALGAPLGLLLLRRLRVDSGAFTAEWLMGELASDPTLYAYITLSTFVVMTIVGWTLGRYDERLERDAAIDALTGLLNRRRLTQIVAQELARARRYNNPLTLALFDVDRFKEVNDRFGHAGGDLALQQIAAGLRKMSRAPDHTARQGGDEFCLLLPETSASEAEVLAGRVAQWLRDAPAYCEGASPITLSVGIAQLDTRADTGADVLWQRADAALYEAKNAGRDRIMVAPAPIAAPVSA